MNDNDKKDLQQYGEIRARSMGRQGSAILQDIPKHIVSASNAGNEDCWISMCKTIRPCIAEYALPQGGKYNTASSRKDIAVIDISFWKNVGSSEECYTVFKGQNGVLVDFENYAKYLPSKQPGMTQDAYRHHLVQTVRKLVENEDITNALFDCSFPRKRYKNINRFDIMKFSSSKNCFRLFDYGLTAISNGIAQKATEVLCYNIIPNCAIKTVLSPVQQDVIYMAKDVKLQDKIIEGLITGSISINWIGCNIEVTVNGDKASIKGKTWMYPALIYEELVASDDIEIKYQQYIQEKKDVLRKALLFILDEFDEKIDSFLLPEERDLRVLDFDKNGHRNLCKEELYDTVAIKYKDHLYTIHHTKNKKTDLIGPIDKSNNLILTLEGDNKINSIF